MAHGWGLTQVQCHLSAVLSVFLKNLCREKWQLECTSLTAVVATSMKLERKIDPSNCTFYFVDVITFVSSPPSLWHWPWYSIRVCQSIFLYSHVELHVPHEHKTSSILVHCQGPFCTPDAPAIKTKDPPHLYFCVKLKFWWIWTLCNKRLDNLWCLQPITHLFQCLCRGNACPLCSSSSSSSSSSIMVSIFADVLVVGAEVISGDLDITLVL
jgi:hypothetical protein